MVREKIRIAVLLNTSGTNDVVSFFLIRQEHQWGCQIGRTKNSDLLCCYCWDWRDESWIGRYGYSPTNHTAVRKYWQLTKHWLPYSLFRDWQGSYRCCYVKVQHLMLPSQFQKSLQLDIMQVVRRQEKGFFFFFVTRLKCLLNHLNCQFFQRWHLNFFFYVTHFSF